MITVEAFSFCPTQKYYPKCLVVTINSRKFAEWFKCWLLWQKILLFNHDGMELPVDDWKHGEHSFVELTHVIQSTHDAAQTCAVKAINRMQTMRNWLIGYYIVEFEQHGKDRAEYGSQLLKKLEEKVERKGLNVTLFQWARKFYNLYPQMADNLVPMNFIKDKGICATASHKSEGIKFIARKSATASHNFMTPGAILISRLSYSHIREIMAIDDPLARYFYEQECIKCTWSVRELRRQISTNLYVRAGISTNPEKMLSLPSMKGHDSLYTKRQENGGVCIGWNG